MLAVILDSGAVARVGTALSLVAALALSGCGAPSPDLFSVTRSGTDRNANLRLVVNDGGRVTCNGEIEKALDAQQLLDARELARDLAELAQLGIELPSRPGSDLRYRVDTEFGALTFADNSPSRPPAVNRLVAFTSTVGEDVCDLER